MTKNYSFVFFGAKVSKTGAKLRHSLKYFHWCFSAATPVFAQIKILTAQTGPIIKHEMRPYSQQHYCPMCQMLKI